LGAAGPRERATRATGYIETLTGTLGVDPSIVAALPKTPT
jgi:hypothetical protein